MQTAPPDLAFAALDRAYTALQSNDYDAAIVGFREAARIAPGRAAIHKNLAYVLLKTGDTVAARNAFREAMILDPGDAHVAMEFAFLCYETGEKVTARRVFDRLRQMEGEHRGTADQAFLNIDRLLAEGIARWKAALADAESFSAHAELAKLAEERDETALAAEHYERAWKLRPDARPLLLDLGRVWKQLGREQESIIALLAASRGNEPRSAERARALLPSRYPYVYEFQQALALDAPNTELRRELAYLHLAMSQRAEAEREFERVVRDAPEDLLSAAQLGFLRLERGEKAAAMPLLDRVLAGSDEELADRVRVALQIPQTLKKRGEAPRAAVSVEAKTLADRSIEKGYLQDALKYLKIAHENDPVDFRVMLKLGWAHNVLRQDDEAVRWFGMARRSPDQEISAEALRAYKNLRGQKSRFRATAWIYPFYSSRWKDVFAYGQVKAEMRSRTVPLRLYVSVRFIGDTRGTTQTAGLAPQFLSENAVIAAAGVATPVWRGAFGWFEAGEAMKYRRHPTGDRLMTPDYRGGVSFNKGLGHMLGPGSRGWFAETNDDGIFISRFNKDFLLYSQNRGGYTFAGNESGSFQAQAFANLNLTTDVQGQPWANFAEAGPGVRVRLPQGLVVTASLLRGVYLVPQPSPRGTNFWDFRVGVWYAFTTVH